MEDISQRLILKGGPLLYLQNLSQASEVQTTEKAHGARHMLLRISFGWNQCRHPPTTL